MTLHRFIYKVLWRSRMIALLIFACTLIAMVTALFHGGLVSSSGQLSNSQRNAMPQASEHKHEHAKPNPDEIETRDLLMHPLKDEHLAVNKQSNEKQVLQHYVEQAKKKAIEVLKIKKGAELPNVIHINRDNDQSFKTKSHLKMDPNTKTQKEKNLTKLTFKPYHSKKLAYNPAISVELFDAWKSSKESFCGGKMLAYFNEFAQLKDVIFDKAFCHGRKGGEEIPDVLMQPEEVEYYTYDLGCIQMACKSRPNYFFNNKNHLNDLIFSLKTKDIEYSKFDERIATGFNLLITRYEYANIYHTMTDWYAAFLLMNFFNKTQSATNIVLVDGHPVGALDPVWPVLFNSTVRLSDLKTRTRFDHLSFSILGYNTHFLDHSTDSIPLLEEFGEFFLQSYRMHYKEKLDCDKLSVLFIWRRDYVAHPRNPKGEVSRKIDNEKELIDFMQKKYPNFLFKGVQIDLFEMHQQLRYVSDADILIGMHGAGLTHALFLPKHGGLIELIPSYWSAANEHFLAIARWRNLKYERWVNTDMENEAPNKHTRIPTQVLNVLFRSMLRQMGCLSSKVHGNV